LSKLFYVLVELILDWKGIGNTFTLTVT